MLTMFRHQKELQFEVKVDRPDPKGDLKRTRAVLRVWSNSKKTKTPVHHLPLAKVVDQHLLKNCVILKNSMMEGCQASFLVRFSFTSFLLTSPVVPFGVTFTSTATRLSPFAIVISETGLGGLNLSL